MIYENLVALNSQEHGRLRLAPSDSMQYAAGEIQTLLLADEIPAAAGSFPIVFHSEEVALPKVILGLEEGKSRFVDDQGQWTTNFIPASLTNYPFSLVRRGAAGGETNDYVLAFAKDSGLLQDESGKLLYNKSGKSGLRPSPLLKEILDKLRNYQQRVELTRRFFQPLVDKKVLTAQKINLGSAENPFTVGGTVGVDWDAVNKLDDSILAEWTRSGLLRMLNLQTYSLRNLASFVAGKEQA